MVSYEISIVDGISIFSHGISFFKKQVQFLGNIGNHYGLSEHKKVKSSLFGKGLILKFCCTVYMGCINQMN